LIVIYNNPNGICAVTLQGKHGQTGFVRASPGKQVTKHVYLLPFFSKGNDTAFMNGYEANVPDY